MSQDWNRDFDDAAQNAQDKVKDTVKRAQDKVNDTFKGTQDAASDTMDSVSEKGQQFAQQAKDTYNRGYESARESLRAYTPAIEPTTFAEAAALP